MMIRRVGLVLLLLVALLWNVIHVIRMVQIHLNDFGRFFYGALSWRGGGSLYDASLATPVTMPDGATTELWNLGTPLFHLLFLPLTTLTPELALTLWGIISLAAWVWSVWRIAHEFDYLWSPDRLLLWSTLFLCFTGTTAHIVTGQVSWILMPLVTMAWLSARGDSWGKTGLWLGLLATLKPLFLIFLPWLLLRQNGKAIQGFFSAMGLAAVCGIALFGWSEHLAWAAVVKSVDWGWLSINGSLFGLLSRSLIENPSYPAFGSWPVFVGPMWLSAGGVIGLVTLWRTKGAHTDKAFVLLLTCALLISPLGWVYYSFWLLGPLWALWRVHNPPKWLKWCAVLGFIPFMLLPILSTHPIATVTVGSLYFWGMLLVWWYSAFRVSAEPAEVSPA